jgi:hypothetical protein
MSRPLANARTDKTDRNDAGGMAQLLARNRALQTTREAPLADNTKLAHSGAHRVDHPGHTVRHDFHHGPSVRRTSC